MKRFFTLLLAASCLTAVGQVRYINEVFTDVKVTEDVVYGSNVTVLPLFQGAAPAAEQLECDIYEPEGDNQTNRPLIIYIHTGNFMPQYANGLAVGSKTDSAAVELCTRFAKMGYVAASINYRLGCYYLAETQSERTNQFINAIYRGVQDARTAVRFFRMSADTMGNPYGVDPTKIGYFGDGTGGYVSCAASTIENYNDFILQDTGAPIYKFWRSDPQGTPGFDYIPMVIEAVNGDPEAITDGYAPPGVLGPDPVQLCIANHVGYSSDVEFQINLGGALGDLNWLDPGDPAMISFQCPADQFAPYTTAVVVVPTTNENVVEVSGAFDIHEEINSQMMPNNNGAYQSFGLSDPYSAQALANGNQGWDGLYPVLNDYQENIPTQPFDVAPWQWWDVATTEFMDAANGTNIAYVQTALNPNMGPLEGRAYCDTIVAYSAPRMAAILGLASQGPGCTDSNACNFNALATFDDGSCFYPPQGYNCNCFLDTNEGGDGFCEELEVSGCIDGSACNYDVTATLSDGSCDYSCCPGPGCCDSGMFWDWELGMCQITNPSDSNFDGCVQLNDLLDLLIAYGDCGAEESPWQCGDPLEYQGYDYETLQIGEQCWFAENLRSENYENGDAIPSGLSDSEWQTTNSGAVAVYGEDDGCSNDSPDIDACDPSQSLSEYGRLYNWYAVDDARGLCPSGWHVPTDGEWTVMTDVLGGESVAGGQMKTTYGWNSGANGTNSSGFSGLPGGYRYYSSGFFYSAGSYGSWWSSSPDGSNAWSRALYSNSEGVGSSYDYRRLGVSVRCVRDAE